MMIPWGTNMAYVCTLSPSRIYRTLPEDARLAATLGPAHFQPVILNGLASLVPE